MTINVEILGKGSKITAFVSVVLVAAASRKNIFYEVINPFVPSVLNIVR